MTEHISQTSQIPESPRPQQESPARRSSWVLVTTGIVGGVVLLGGIGLAAASGIVAATHKTPETQTMTVDADGIRELDIEVSSSNLIVLFDGLGDPGAARLDVEGGGDEWELRRDDDTLTVDSRRAFPLDWFRFGPLIEQQVVLSLPVEMQRQLLDADLDVSSGSLSIDATFGDLEIDVSSGSASIGGGAQSLDAGLSSGSLHLSLVDVEKASLGVSSGQLRAELTGRAPRELEVGVSSGSADITLPDEAYAVSSRVSSGSFDNVLRVDPSSRYRIDVGISSGRVALGAGV